MPAPTVQVARFFGPLRVESGFFGKLCAIKAGVVPTANALVQRAYDRIARVYDFFFGAILEPGRVRAVRAIRSKPGLRVLELGIGTGLTMPLYSRDWSVTGVDLSPAMLMQARKRMTELGLTGR